LYKDSEGKNALKINPYSWNKNANLLYIDQPIGTGFSFGEKDKYAKN
jgi:cathepsin A (carboxypeptidase C)